MISPIIAAYALLSIASLGSLGASGDAHSAGYGTALGDARKAQILAKITVRSCSTVDGICIEVGEQASMRPVKQPGTRKGPVVLCVWFRYGTANGGWDNPNGTFPVKRLIPGYMYVVACYHHHVGTWVTGYPRVHVYRPGGSIPGGAVNGWEVGQYAKGLLPLERPRVSVAPPTRQLVGIETWFSVISRLHYQQKTAQAGNTWATVKADFSHVLWDFGIHGKLRCTTHAALRWDPSRPGSEQNSDCTKVFTNKPAGSGRLNAKVTATWNVRWRSNEHYGWRSFGTYSLSSTVPLDIAELQAVIR